MTKRDINLLINSTSLFLISYTGIRFIMALAKITLAVIFGIDINYEGFTIFATSPAWSPAWNFKSVYVFYSLEPLFLLLLITASYIFLFRNIIQKPILYFLVSWSLISSIALLTAKTVASILTRTDLYHLLNWSYIPFHIMLLIGGFVLISGSVALYLAGKKYIISSSILKLSTNKNDIYISSSKSVIAPIFLGLIILLLSFGGICTTYGYIEFIISFICILPLYLQKRIYEREMCDDLSEKISVHLILASVTLSLFSMLLRLI